MANDMKSSLMHRLLALAGGVALLLAGASPGGEVGIVPEFAPPAESGWDFEVGLYGFLAGVDGELSVGDQSVDIEYDFSDILENLDATFMATVNARYDRFHLGVDLLYMEMSGDASPAGPVFERASMSLDSLVVTASGTYRLWESPDGFFDLGAGVRYFEMDTGIVLQDRNGPVPTVRASEDASLWDGLGVARFHYQITPKWFFRGCGDVGAGDSQLTWQLFGAIGYLINDHAALLLGWRHLAYELESGPAELDIFLSGPQLGMGFRF